MFISSERTRATARKGKMKSELEARQSRGKDYSTRALPCHYKDFRVRTGKQSKSLLIPWPGVGLENANLKTTLRYSGLFIYLGC